jgi:type III secretion protein X
MNDHLSPLNFDRGITQIVHLRDAQPLAMPPFRQLDPAEIGVQPQLDQLLAARTLDTLIDESIRPQVQDRALLHPAAFRAAVEAGRETLLTAAERNPAEARVLNRAARVLGEEISLRELLQMYRNVLFQG